MCVFTVLSILLAQCLVALLSSSSCCPTPVVLSLPPADQEWTCTKTVDLNPDPQGSSDRPEWTTVHYDAIFRPQVAFQMEFQWVVTTATVLAKQASTFYRNCTKLQRLCRPCYVPHRELTLTHILAFIYVELMLIRTYVLLHDLQ